MLSSVSSNLIGGLTVQLRPKNIHLSLIGACKQLILAQRIK